MTRRGSGPRQKYGTWNYVLRKRSSRPMRCSSPNSLMMESTFALNHRFGAPRSSMYRYAVDSVNRCAALCPARSGEEYRRLTVVGGWLLREVSHDWIMSIPRCATLRLSDFCVPVVTLP